MRKTLAAAALMLAASLAPAWAQDPSYGGSGVNFEMRLSAVEDQLRALTGKTEQLDYAVRRLDQTLQRLQGDYDMRLSRLEAVPPAAAQPAVTNAPQPVPAVPSAAPSAGTTVIEPPASAGEPANPETSVKGTLGGIKMQGGKITGAVVNPKAPPLPETPADYGLTPQEQYDRAFGLLRQANYEEAEKAFHTFIEKNPQDKMLDNAKYWYAETYYVRAKYPDAVAAFADAYQQNPQGTKAPDSLLKLSMALAATDKVPEACTTLGELKKKYPNAAATVRARADQEIARLKCPKR